VVEEDEEEAEKAEKAHELKRQEGEKIKLQFGGASTPTVGTGSGKESESAASVSGTPAAESGEQDDGKGTEPVAPKRISMKFGAKPQPKNVFKNAFAGATKKVMAVPPKKMSEAERIMKEELERKRARETGGTGGGPPSKKMKFQF